MSDSLGIDDDVMGLAMLTVGNDIIDNILFVVIVLLGKQDILGALAIPHHRAMYPAFLPLPR